MPTLSVGVTQQFSKKCSNICKMTWRKGLQKKNACASIDTHEMRNEMGRADEMVS